MRSQSKGSGVAFRRPSTRAHRRVGLVTVAAVLGLLSLAPMSAAQADESAPTASASSSTTTEATTSAPADQAGMPDPATAATTATTAAPSAPAEDPTTPPSPAASDPQPDPSSSGSGTPPSPPASSQPTTTAPNRPTVAAAKVAFVPSATDLRVALVGRVLVDKNKNKRVDAGEVYRISWKVTNTTAEAATRLVVTTASGSTTCAATSLPAGASTTCTTVRTLSQTDVDAGSVSVSARASATVGGSTTTTGWVPAPVSIPAVRGLSVSQFYNLTRDADGDHRVSVGDTVGFVYDVSNSGNVTLVSPSVTSRLLRDRGLAVICPKSTLYTAADRPGQTVRCWSPGFVIQRGQWANGKLVNSAVISATAKVGGARVSTTSTLVISPIAQRYVKAPKPPKPPKAPQPKPGLQLVSRISHVTDEYFHNGYTDTGDKVTLQFVVSNIGQTQLSRIMVTDTLLAKQSIGVSCPAASLAPRQSMTCTGMAQYVVTRQDFSSGALKTVSVAQAYVDLTGRTIGSRAKLDRPLAVKLAQTLGSSSLAMTGPSGLPGLATTSGLLILLGCAFVLTARRRAEPRLAVGVAPQRLGRRPRRH